VTNLSLQMTNNPRKGRGHGRATQFKSWIRNHVSRAAKGRVVIFRTQVRYSKC